MPEVKDLSEALPETSLDPLTGVGVVASRNRAPTGYDVVSRATCWCVSLPDPASACLRSMPLDPEYGHSLPRGPRGDGE